MATFKCRLQREPRFEAHWALLWCYIIKVRGPASYDFPMTGTYVPYKMGKYPTFSLTLTGNWHRRNFCTTSFEQHPGMCTKCSTAHRYSENGLLFVCFLPAIIQIFWYCIIVVSEFCGIVLKLAVISSYQSCKSKKCIQCKQLKLSFRKKWAGVQTYFVLFSTTLIFLDLAQFTITNGWSRQYDCSGLFENICKILIKVNIIRFLLYATLFCYLGFH